MRPLLLAFCLLAASHSEAAQGQGNRGETLIIGADISSVNAAEDRGVRYSDAGVQKDILAILKDRGFN